MKLPIDFEEGTKEKERKLEEHTAVMEAFKKIMQENLEEKKKIKERKVEALKAVKKLAETDPDMMYQLALIHKNGGWHADDEDWNAALGNKDDGEYYTFLTKAANAGHTIAEFELGEHLLHQSRNDNLARDYLEKAAEKGHVEAQNIVGEIYFGRAADKSYPEAPTERKQEKIAKAIALFRKAADQGLAKAQYNLGKCYEFGKGVEESEEKAIEWYKKAVDGDGCWEAQEELEFLTERKNKKAKTCE